KRSWSGTSVFRIRRKACRARMQSPGRRPPKHCMSPARRGPQPANWHRRDDAGSLRAAALEDLMTDVTLYGFPRSTYVKAVELILIARDVTYRFYDTETEMYLPVHLTRHPFGRVPAMQHGDFMLYETSAIAAYIDDVFPGRRLTPSDPRRRARMNQ